MATGTFPQPTPPPVQPADSGSLDASGGSSDRFIEEQLRKTRAQVKIVDIVGNSLAMLCGALGFMLVLALIDHWLFALGFWTRLVALLVLVAGCGWWFAVRILPLIIRRINPVYAAMTIEMAEPSLKNSLINFLLLRGRRGEVHEVVYDALGQRAASDLSHVPADTAVDHSHLIRIGYVLAALLAVGAAYKILSPKDPLQSVARVMAPWANIDRPSRVQIEDVQPGDATVFQGERLEVSALVRGVGDADEVQLLFSTADGQLVDQQLTMQPDSAGVRHVAQLPPGERGIQQNLHYKIFAGDAETRWYNVQATPAPHILVTQVLYEPPRYTGRPAEEGTSGDISGLEGTRVTIVARANREIETAYLEFDPISGDEAADADAPLREPETVRIRQIDGQQAQLSFHLRLEQDPRRPAEAQRPWHEHYWLRFTTKEGHRNNNPVVHSISVKPDLAPLVEILTPVQRRVEVPLNGRQEIEVRGIDHDFALSRMQLVGVAGGKDLFDMALLDDPAGRPGQVVETFEFRPEDHELAVGDVVEYWAVAEDNRRDFRSGRPKPNVTRSRPSYRIEITPPERGETATPPDDAPSDRDLEAGDDGNSSSDGPAEQPPRGGDAGGEKPDDNKKPSDANSGESGGETERGSSDAQPGENTDAGEGASQDQPAGNDSTKDGTSPEQRGSEQSQPGGAGNERGGSPESESAPRDEPLENDGSRDGDVFEKIQEHRRQQQQQQNEQGGSSPSGADSGPQDDSSSNSGESSSGGSSGSQNEQSPSGGDQSSQDQSGGPQGNRPGEQQSGTESPGSAQSGGDDQQGKRPGDSQSGGDGSGNQGDKPEGGSTDAQQQNSGGSNSQQKDGGKQSGGQQPNPSGSSASQQKDGGQQSGDQQNSGGGNQGQKPKDGGGNQGGQPQGGQKPGGNQQQSGGEGNKPMGGGGQGQNDQSGAGQQNDGGGSPQQQAENPQQRNKQKSGGGGQQQSGNQQQQGKSPSGNNKDSDSQGDSGGDRKGGGEQGGGQSSQRPGQDSAGSGSSGEQGDGAANEPGSGQSGSRGGGDQIANNPTGRSGEQSGEGSSSGEAREGDPRQQQPQDGSSQGGDSSKIGNRPGGDRPREGETGTGTGQDVSGAPGEGRGTVPTGGGKPADNHPSDTPLPDVEPGSDKANLEYARKATDMTLEYLKNQQQNPDRELLDKLGWTKDDLATFVDRWERMRQAAGREGAAGDDARRRLDDSLRSLGLRPETGTIRTGRPTTAPAAGSRDSGRRSRPPKQYAEQYRAFSKFVKPAEE